MPDVLLTHRVGGSFGAAKNTIHDDEKRAFFKPFFCLLPTATAAPRMGLQQNTGTIGANRCRLPLG